MKLHLLQFPLMGQQCCGKCSEFKAALLPLCRLRLLEPQWDKKMLQGMWLLALSLHLGLPTAFWNPPTLPELKCLGGGQIKEDLALSWVVKAVHLSAPAASSYFVNCYKMQSNHWGKLNLGNALFCLKQTDHLSQGKIPCFR